MGDAVFRRRKGIVTFKNRPAGQLLELPSGATRFSYLGEWAESIACALPRSLQHHEWPKGLHPVFEHLGAEGWLRARQARAGRIDDRDDFGLLLRYGSDCIGAVGIEPEDAPATSPEQTEGSGAGAVVERRTISGVQRKLLVYRDETGIYRPAGSTGPAPFIAKFNGADLDTLVINEVRTLTFAQHLLGAKFVTEFEPGRVDGMDEPALLVHRFDRGEGGEKLRLEDFAQILVRPAGLDFRGKYDAAYEDIAAGLLKYSAVPVIDLDRLFRRVVVAAVSGDCDAHLKNFSLLESVRGLRLAPAYDVINTACYARQGYGARFALALGGEYPRYDDITANVLDAFGTRIGLSRASIESAFRDIKAAAKRSRLLDRGGVEPGSFPEQWIDIVSEACRRILET